MTASFEPQLVTKRGRLRPADLAAVQPRDEQAEDPGLFRETYEDKVAASLVSRVTNAVHHDIEDGCQRQQDVLYPFVYLDGLVVKVRTEGTVQRRSTGT